MQTFIYLYASPISLLPFCCQQNLSLIDLVSLSVPSGSKYYPQALSLAHFTSGSTRTKFQKLVAKMMPSSSAQFSTEGLAGFFLTSHSSSFTLFHYFFFFFPNFFFLFLALIPRTLFFYSSQFIWNYCSTLFCKVRIIIFNIGIFSIFNSNSFIMFNLIFHEVILNI